MKYLKNAILCASLLALGATQLIYSMDDSARSDDGAEEAAETPIEEGGITKMILEALREARPKDWCVYFPASTVCDPYFKELACDGRITAEYQRSFRIAIPEQSYYNNIHLPKGGRVNLSLGGRLKKRSIERFVASFRIKGGKEIEKYKKDFPRYSDKHTSCGIVHEWEDYRGIPMASLICETFGLTYKQFEKAMSK